MGSSPSRMETTNAGRLLAWVKSQKGKETTTTMPFTNEGEPPNLNFDCIATGTHKGLNLQILFELFEKDLHLPTVFIDRGNGRKTPIH